MFGKSYNIIPIMLPIAVIQQAGLKPTYYCLFLCFRPFYFCLCFYANTMPCVCFILPINVANVYGEEGENQK